MRLKLSGLYASGDDDPYDGTDEGFDAIFENPQFAGADTSYFIRQAVPADRRRLRRSSAAATRVLPALRSSKEQGQSNFTNPGLTLLGTGADFDILPELRLSLNANYLRFNETEVLEAIRQQDDIDNEIGWDLSAAIIWRPFITQNVVFRLSGATLFAGEGFKQLYATDDDVFYSGLGEPRADLLGAAVMFRLSHITAARRRCWRCAPAAFAAEGAEKPREIAYAADAAGAARRRRPRRPPARAPAASPATPPPTPPACTGIPAWCWAAPTATAAMPR